jgi:hypothetical protein
MVSGRGNQRKEGQTTRVESSAGKEPMLNRKAKSALEKAWCIK